MMLKIWLDDVRPAPMGWEWVKSVRDLQAMIVLHGLANVAELSLDHDLGENIPTGYDFLSWLESKVADEKLVEIPVIEVHSANPVGRENMKRAIGKIFDIGMKNIKESFQASRAT